MGFNNKVAVVTGAGGTLCSEIAIELAKQGAKVVLVGRTEEKLQKTAEKIVEVLGENAIDVILRNRQALDEVPRLSKKFSTNVFYKEFER